ncbi:MAG: DUF4340 domain-containing protein [Treponemataceae bacterium]
MKISSKIQTFGLRKIILLSSILILAIIFVCQFFVGGANDGYKLTLKNGVDSITIQNGTSTPITLINSAGNWILKNADINPEEENVVILANAEYVKQMTNFISKIDVIGSVSKNGNEDTFGFGENSSLFVFAKKDGKLVRSFELGKNSISTQQVYARLDGSKEVVLLGGNPKYIFDKTFEQLKAQITE